MTEAELLRRRQRHDARRKARKHRAARPSRVNRRRKQQRDRGNLGSPDLRRHLTGIVGKPRFDPAAMMGLPQRIRGPWYAQRRKIDNKAAYDQGVARKQKREAAEA